MRLGLYKDIDHNLVAVGLVTMRTFCCSQVVVLPVCLLCINYSHFPEEGLRDQVSLLWYVLINNTQHAVLAENAINHAPNSGPKVL